ncbi:flavodoxin domain-containing protein [Patescibacteria group bacterium]
MASVLIIFGSTGGNTEIVTDEVAEVLSNSGHKVTVQRAEESDVKDLKGYSLYIFASSTYGQGLLQDHMLKFFYKVKQTSLKGKKCAVIGLGDNKYNTEYVIESAKILEKGIKEIGGKLIVPALRINKTPVPYLDTSVKDWAKKLSKAIK